MSLDDGILEEPDDAEDGGFEEEDHPRARTYLEVSGQLRYAFGQYLEGITSRGWFPDRLWGMMEVLSAAVPDEDLYLHPGWLKLDSEFGRLPFNGKMGEEHYLARGAFFRRVMKRYGMIGQTVKIERETGPTIIDVTEMFWRD